MKLDALDHPKTLDLAARLEVELPTAIGHLELLWAFTGKKAPQGNVGKWPDGAIARACYWMGRPEQFTQALHESGFLDADPLHRLTVHDWREHAPRWVKSKLKSLGLEFVGDAMAADISGDTSPDTGGDTKGREVKGSEGKGETRERARPDGLDATAWDRWLAYRHAMRKPIREASRDAAMQALAKFGADQAAVVEQSIANGWQGLFALKDKPFHVKPGEEPGTKRVPTPEQRAASDRKALEASARAYGINPAGLSESQINSLIWESQNAKRGTA